MFKTLFILLALTAPVKVQKGPAPELSVIESEQRDGFVCQMVEYSTSKTERVRSFLLIPDGASKKSKRPALVLLHDHGGRYDIGKEKLVRPLKSAPEYIKRSSQQWIDDNFDGVYFGEKLARMGYVVIVPDQLYWGGRSTEACQRLSRMQFGDEKGDIKAMKHVVGDGLAEVYDSLSRKGVIWAEQTLDEDAQAARVLKSLPYVDAKNIGSFGWSMGAHRSWLLTAFCREVKTGVALCWMSVKEYSHAADHPMYIPAFRDNYDYPDIAQWLAPKPYLFLAGTKDNLFPVWAVEKAYRRMNEIYGQKGDNGRLQTEFFEGPHHCGIEVQRRICDFLSVQLDQKGRLKSYDNQPK